MLYCSTFHHPMLRHTAIHYSTPQPDTVLNDTYTAICHSSTIRSYQIVMLRNLISYHVITKAFQKLMHKHSVRSLLFSKPYQGTLSTINAVLKCVTLVLYFYFPTEIFQVHLHCRTVSAVQLNSFVRLDPLNTRLARLNIIARLTL